MKRLVYLDNAATTQPFPEVLDAMIPYYSRYYGNPSSGYELGEESKRAMSLSRKWIADKRFILRLEEPSRITGHLCLR